MIAPHEQERSSREHFHAPYGVERDRVTDIGGKVLLLLSPLLPLLRCCSAGKARSAGGRAIVQPYVKSPCHPHARSVHACERAIRRVIGRSRGDVHI